MRLALVSSRVSATRQRFTLAHELGHLIAGDAHDLTVAKTSSASGPRKNAARTASQPHF